MSSNGSRAARHLRADTAALLAESESAFAAQFSKFKGAVRRSKAVSSLNGHQLAWRREAAQIAKQRKQLEGEVDAIITGMAADKTVCDEDVSADVSLASHMRDLSDTRVAMQHETQASARELQAAVRRARALLKAARQQKAQESGERKALIKKPASSKKKSVGFAVPHAPTAERESDPASTSAATASPLSSLLSSFIARVSIDQQQLAAEERNLVEQLSLMQSSLQRFEAPIEEDQTETTPSDEATGAEEIDGTQDSLQATSSLSPTFLTATATTTLSPRTRRTYRSTTTLLANSPFPSIPDPDPSLLTLPAADLDRAHASRAADWVESASALHQQVDRRFEHNLLQLREAFHSDTHALRRTIERIDRECAWTEHQSSRMQSILASYKNQGAKHAQLLDRLRLEFAADAAKIRTTGGTRDPLCINERVDLYDRTRAYKIQRAALHTAWEAERGLFISRAREELLASDRILVADHARALATEEQQAIQAQLHSELDVMRVEKAERDAVQAATDARRQQEAAEEQAIKAEREAILREKQRTLLQLYHDHLAAEESAQSAQADRDRQAALEETRLALELNKPKVERRQEMLQERRAAQARREESDRIAEAEREARLDAIRQLVAPSVDRDPSRVLQATQASAAEGDATNPLFAVHGYDMSALLKDKRFRLQLALWNAGVSHTAYAKEMVASAAPAIAPRPDMQSTLFARAHA